MSTPGADLLDLRGDRGKAQRPLRADAWSDTAANIGAYARSKTLAERAAWDAVEGGTMELTVINPGAVFGPSLGATWMVRAWR